MIALVDTKGRRLYNSPSYALALEIGDPIASMNPDHTAAALAQMRRLGVTTALDDFGSNSISLTSLRRCSYDVLKIDRSLISSMQADRTSQDVVDVIPGAG
jgi:c-di-GMP phosphodiesterase